jgi:hypothetical protein
MQLTTHLHLVPRVRMSGAKPQLLLGLHVVDAEENVTYFTFYYIYIYIYLFSSKSTLMRIAVF